MEDRKDAIVAVIGQEKYDEECAVLKKVKDQEDKTGAFHAISGNVDCRSESVKGDKLAEGFNT
jgi:hypothetical protein